MSHKQSEIRTVLPVPKNGLKIIDGQSFKARTTGPLESGTTGKGGGVFSENRQISLTCEKPSIYFLNFLVQSIDRK